MEPIARAAYEAKTGNMMQPAERTHRVLRFMRASLDGITLDGRLILEVKCPGKEAHAEAVAGRVPVHYMSQVQSQLFVADAERAHYWSFDGTNGVLIEVLPDVAMQTRIVDACTAFWAHVQADTPPDATPGDERADDEWTQACSEYIAATRDADESARLQKLARDRLVKLAPQGAKGAGVNLVRVERAGAIAYAKVLKQMLPDVDLEPYRGAATTSYQVRID
jgi:predicted phage-related endonuclease